MKRLIYGVCVVAIMLATSLSFVSCDDYVQDEFTELRGDINSNIGSLNSRIDSLKIRVKNLETGYQGAIDSINALKHNVDTLKYDVDTLKQDIARLDSIVAALQNSLDSVSALAHKLDSLENAVATIDFRVDSLENAVDTIDFRVDSLETKVDTIASKVTNLEKSLQDAQKTIAELSKSVNELLKSYECQITSIILQGTYNNVFGSIRLPFDFQSMLVAGHYGTITADGGEVVFPKQVAGVTPSKSYTFQNGETNRETSGYAYLTINPNTVDIAGVKFSLVNSLDSTIGFKIDTVVKSNDKLSFGWTRADNGFYRATISTDENVGIDALKPRIDLNDIISVIKSAVNDLKAKKMFDLSSIARVIYENSTDILDATAIKATWTDGFGKEKSVYTNYDMAATVMKPLSFEFNIDYYADKLAKQLDKLHVNTISDVAFDFNMNIEYADLDTIVEATYPIVIMYNGTRDTINGVADLSKFIEMFNLYYAGHAEVSINELIDEIKSQSKGEVNRAIDLVNDYVHKINNYINKYNNYLTRLTNKLVDIDFNNFLQPCILISSGSNFGQVSSNRDVPTFVKGESVILTPTSYTSELIAPAMYKYLAVASVKDLDGNEIAGVADKCNNADYNMNVPFANKQQVVLVMPESNALYEINYQAIDWSGKIVSGTYYIYSL